MGANFFVLAAVWCSSAFVSQVQSDVHVLHMDLAKAPLRITNQRFLSVALGAGLIAEDFRGFDLTNPRLQKLMAPLSPAYLRIGGTMANKLWFSPSMPSVQENSRFSSQVDNGEDCFYDGKNCDRSLEKDFTMTGTQWLGINRLASKSGLKILFDINDLRRLDDGSWDSRNAESLLEFSEFHNLSVIWELGNEPTLYKNHHDIEISPAQLASDFIRLRTILNRFPQYKSSLLVGPDMAQPKPNNIKLYRYLEEFLARGGGGAVDAVTWHQYNLNGNTAQQVDFLNPDVFDELKNQINRIEDVVRSSGSNKPIWLGETANAYGGGAPGMSDRFIATFLWLDKLGVAALYGLDLVVRQTLFKSHYALVDSDLTPNPDWWVSVLYKTLVGPKVIACNTESSKDVRLYCHCTSKRGLHTNETSITVFGLNLRNAEVRVQLREIGSEKVAAYVLTGHSHLTSKSVVLNNNQVLSLSQNGDLPRFRPLIVKSQPFLMMPPFSLAFWVVPSSSLVFC